MTVLHWLGSYWGWAGSNVGAMPACAAVGAAFAVLLRKPLVRLWRKHSGADAAEAAHRIAADLYRHHVGHAHPDAPEAPEAAKEAS